MARMISKAKTSRIKRATTSAPPSDVSAYCRDLHNWPRSWMGVEKDVPPGEQLLACFRPFIEHLASSTLSPKTIRKHVDNLWMLGGEIIRGPKPRPFSEKSRGRPQPEIRSSKTEFRWRRLWFNGAPVKAAKTIFSRA